MTELARDRRVREESPRFIPCGPLTGVVDGHNSVDVEVDCRLLRDRILEVLPTLTAQERLVVVLRFGLSSRGMHSMDAIARLQRWPPGRPFAVLAKALFKLRHPTRAQHIESFVY